MLIPIRAEIRTHEPARVNYVLIAVNVLAFLFTDVFGGGLGQQLKNACRLDAGVPMLYEYFTYQFLHSDWMHLIGNMLFLWIFGNAVCDRMGGLVYLIFYVAGGVFAGVVFGSVADNPIIGASGAIAAVTTAFLVLFPRVQITMLWALYIITTFQIPAMIVIVFKIILWDNVLAPSIQSGTGVVANVAYSAHLGGYAYGFAIGWILLASGALPRNQFDIVALWNRWRRRTGLTPATAARSRPPRVARPIHAEELGSEPLARLELSPAERLREQILDALDAQNGSAAVGLYRELLARDPEQVLPRRRQLEIANLLKQHAAPGEAAAAYEAYLRAYPGSADEPQVQLLLGLIYRRYEGRPELAAERLRAALAGLTQSSQRGLAEQELREAEAQLLGRDEAPPPAS